MRDFEKISFEQFKNDIGNDEELYNEYLLPKRDSIYTAGYDIYLLENLTIKPGERKKVPTGIKSYFNKDEVLLIVIRSSMGFKHNIKLCNQVGIIDADYYNNADNQGHIWLMIQNEGDKECSFKKGEAIVQGIFVKYLTTKRDDKLNIQRKSNY